MNKVPEIIQQSKLLRRLVLDKKTVETQGRVEKLWLNENGDRLVGITCKLGFFGQEKKYLTWEEIDTIGADAILVNINPDRPVREGREPGVLAIGSEIWTDAGNKAGLLVDYLLNATTGAIVDFLYKSNGWRGIVDGLYTLSSEAVISAGARRMIVIDDAMQSPQLYTPGLGHKVSQATNYLEEDLQKTKEHIESVRRGSQEWAGEFQGKAQQVREQAQQKAEEFKEKAQTLATEAQQKAGEIKEKVREQHQELKQRSESESTEETPDRFQNQITAVTTKAKEMIGGIAAPRLDNESQAQEQKLEAIASKGESQTQDKSEDITPDNLPKKP